ncbi:S8/S53 family peptidase [Pigmentibacter sp. JX0631]|uniref:S8/S53 family peptidase n=1 Tax=Pigmentibacter sp. JX0631 TaxID=2976982 RepID=UPI002469123F|nr:S8/S53 family peptidase [Pigmentibacter sp. JX0631]WGL60955.1 S8/S53 family peptidase [Pigmentibacter sp. JX0631]
MKYPLFKKFSLFLILVCNGYVYAEYTAENYAHTAYPNNFTPVYHGIDVTVIDSEVKSNPYLNIIKNIYHINKNIHFNENDMVEYEKNVNDYNTSRQIRIHGTAISSIIGSTALNNKSKHSLGIFPAIPIINRVAIPNINASQPFLEALKAAVFSGNEKIINISGGYQGDDYQVWHDTLSSLTDRNDFLIIASVGNDHFNMDLLGPDKLIWPSAYKPTKVKAKNNDPVLRVGAIKYLDNHSVELYTNALGGGSRYSPKRVDIAALGHNVPYLDENGQISYANGTSMSAAIVSGVTAVIWNCRPHATAQEIKQILIETADVYDNLKNYVKEGRVLNSIKAIQNACTFDESNMENSPTHEDETIEAIPELNNIHKNDLKNIPVKWKINISNNGYENYTLASHNSLKSYVEKFSVVNNDHDLQFFLTESGQIVTTDGEKDSIPLCLTVASVESSTWQKIGFLPCRKSLKMYQEWDLRGIPAKIFPNEKYVFSSLKLKNADICLRMKNRFIHWGDLFVSHCADYNDPRYFLSLEFDQTNAGFSKIDPIDYDYRKLKVGDKQVGSSYYNYALLKNESQFVFRYDISTFRMLGFKEGGSYDYKMYCIIKNNDSPFKKPRIEMVGKGYSYLKISECNENVLPKEQFYPVSNKYNKDSFYLFSLLEEEKAISINEFITGFSQKERIDTHKNLCVGSHKGYLWLGECAGYVIDSWHEQSSFYFAD